MTENVISHSPAVAASMDVPGDNFLNFFDALKCVAEGKSIARKIWPDGRSRARLYSSRLMIFDVVDNVWHPWTIDASDFSAEDWYILS